jgi:hypothetical protein
MTTNAPSNRLVSALAVGAVSIAALATAASSWVAREDAPPAAVQAAQRPAADEPVRVVKAPPAAAARQQPASCRECADGRSMERRL